MEHVLGGVRASDGDDRLPRGHVVDLGARPWFGSTNSSAVQLTILTDDEDWTKPH